MSEQERNAPAPGAGDTGDPVRTDAPARMFPVVGLGGSAGGLRALQEFLRVIPADSGCADGRIIVRDGAAYDRPDRPTRSGHARRRSHDARLAPSYRPFFRALAADRGDRAIAVILSGSGTDGTIGVKEIKAEFGLVLVQQPETADLQSANEELQSTNEELQSTNEELETSKEEMESLNEELSAVNAELQEKIHSLEQANNDMNNRLNSTEIAILFLRRNLEVGRFTDKVRDLIALRESDIGRPIAELSSNLRYHALLDGAEPVLRTVETRKIDFQTQEGHWSRMRIMPYWTLDQRVDGLVCTFIGIDESKRAERGEAFLRSIVQTVREPLLVLDADLRVVSANAPFYRGFADVRGLIEELRVHQSELEIQNEELLAESRDRYRELYEAAPVGYVSLEGERNVELNPAACEILGGRRDSLVGARFSDFVAPEALEAHRLHRDQVRQTQAAIVTDLALHNLRGRRWFVRVESRPAEREDARHCALVDVSARKQAKLQLRQINSDLEREVQERVSETHRREAHLRATLAVTPDAILTLDSAGRIQQANPATEQMFERTGRELADGRFAALLPEPYAGEYADDFAHHGRENPQPDAPAPTIMRREIAARRRSGATFPAEVSVAHADREPLFVVTVRDQTRAKLLEQEVLTAAEQERARSSRELHDSVGQQLAGLALSARSLTQRLEREGSSQAATFAPFSGELQESARGLRQVVHDLAPLELEHSAGRWRSWRRRSMRPTASSARAPAISGSTWPQAIHKLGSSCYGSRARRCTTRSSTPSPHGSTSISMRWTARSGWLYATMAAASVAASRTPPTATMPGSVCASCVIAPA